MEDFSRRRFIKNMGVGTPVIGAAGISGLQSIRQIKTERDSSLPREVWIASMTQEGMTGNNIREVMDAALKRMELALANSPDIICLPEVFHVAGVHGGRPPLEETVEDGSGELVGRFQKFARDHNCYVICPIYSKEEEKIYNAAFVIDRKGSILGTYKKIRPTIGEVKKGISPGPPDVPVFDTDFGKIGIQICYDIEWDEGWERLRNKGAEIVFWPSAFAGGAKVNTKAWIHQYCVVSSTRKDTTKICDITGETLASSGLWSKWGISTPVNLEKVIIHSWPASNKFPEIQKKYGRKINCYSYHEEEFSVIESLSEDVKVRDVLREFEMVSYRESLEEAEKYQQGKL